MNKALKIINILLSIIIIIFNIFFIKNYYINYIFYNLYLVLYILFMINLFKNKNNLQYNILSTIVLIIMLLIFNRVFFDKSFIFNDNKYRTILDYYININHNSLNTYYENIKNVGRNFLYSNCFIFDLLLILLFIYRRINFYTSKSNYKILNICCLIFSVILLIFSINISINNVETSLEYVILSIIPHAVENLQKIQIIYYYIFINIILVGIEIFSLIKNNKNKILIYSNFLINFITLIFLIATIFI